MAVTAPDQYTKNLKFQVENLEKVLDLITKDIQDIKEALLGNEFNKEGLVSKVENNEKQIEELMKFKQKIIAWATGAGLGSGTLVNLLMDLIK
jgi:DNA-binding transcriptional regulator GbsR (MarR family)